MQQKLAQEEIDAQLLQREKKIRLREIQERDQMQKLEQRKLDFLPTRSQDFAQKNLLSYIYEKKDHKAYEYRKKNDMLQNLMKNQFNSTQFQSKDHERAILREEAEKNRKTDESIQARMNDRKRKELEAKLYLDKQIEEKN
jgi:hypothetical protein